MTEIRHLSETGRRAVETEESRKLLDGGNVFLSTKSILRMLREHGHTITFFIVGEVHDWYPELIQEIKELGHEVAYHSHTHVPIDGISSLVKDLQESERFIAGFKPVGFRAPRASMTVECLRELARHGFVYDSSSYGSLCEHTKMAGIIEIPISTYRLRPRQGSTFPNPFSARLLGNLEIPFGSGYSVSLFSLVSPSIVSYFIKKCNQRGVPSILCLHPWQLCRRRIRSLSNAVLSRLWMLPYDLSCLRAFKHLLKNHEFCTISELIENMGIS